MRKLKDTSWGGDIRIKRYRIEWFDSERCLIGKSSPIRETREEAMTDRKRFSEFCESQNPAYYSVCVTTIMDI